MTKTTETLADIMNEAGRMVVKTYITKLHAEELATQGRGASKKIKHWRFYIMIINNNIPALNTHRQLGINQNMMQKSMEKLSSGMRINRAGDDAAGLAISEKMRAQIRGLDQASRNAQDGISLIQTAEGALDETHSILQRMRELAVQSSNDTNTNEDREELQKEVNQLAEELTRIGNNTEFNTQGLLDGSLTNKFHIGANSDQNIELSINDMRAEALGVVHAEATTTTVGSYEVESSIGEDVTIEIIAPTEANSDISSSFDEDSNTLTITLATEDDGSGGITVTSTHDDVLGAINSQAGLSAKLADGQDGDDTASAVNSTTIDAATIDNTRGIDISSQKAADAAITTINDAIETVSAERSKLGAVQNRLEHTIANLDNASENLSAAESRIRDVDMAAEMMEMAKANILSQASQAMLAQANQQPQAVLQLLQ